MPTRHYRQERQAPPQQQASDPMAGMAGVLDMLQSLYGLAHGSEMGDAQLAAAQQEYEKNARMNPLQEQALQSEMGVRQGQLDLNRAQLDDLNNNRDERNFQYGQSVISQMLPYMPKELGMAMLQDHYKHYNRPWPMQAPTLPPDEFGPGHATPPPRPTVASVPETKGAELAQNVQGTDLGLEEKLSNILSIPSYLPRKAINWWQTPTGEKPVDIPVFSDTFYGLTGGEDKDARIRAAIDKQQQKKAERRKAFVAPQL